jgi:hypothetical protein
MKIQFELTEKQAEVVKELIKRPANQGKDENEACRILVVNALIQAKQQMVVDELSK